MPTTETRRRCPAASLLPCFLALSLPHQVASRQAAAQTEGSSYTSLSLSVYLTIYLSVSLCFSISNIYTYIYICCRPSFYEGSTLVGRAWTPSSSHSNSRPMVTYLYTKYLGTPCTQKQRRRGDRSHLPPTRTPTLHPRGAPTGPHDDTSYWPTSNSGSSLV